MRKNKNINTISCLLVLFGGGASVFASHGNLFSIASDPAITDRAIIDILKLDVTAPISTEQLVEYLQGYNPETGDGPGMMTPFLLAAFNGNGVPFLRAVARILSAEGLMALLQVRSRDDKTGKYGNTPVHLAAKWPDGKDFIAIMGKIFTKNQLMELLEMPGRLDYSPLQTAIEFGNGAAFLKAEAKILGDDRNMLVELLRKRSLGGKTPLHEATYAEEKGVRFVKTVARILGQEEFVALLKEVDDCGNTPLFEATVNCNKAFLNTAHQFLPPHFRIICGHRIRCDEEN
jgi:hypothetical protein